MNDITEGGVEESERTREDVVVLMDDAWRSAEINFGFVTTRSLWLKFRFSRGKLCVVVLYGPTGGNVEERARFWKDLDKVICIVGNV